MLVTSWLSLWSHSEILNIIDRNHDYIRISVLTQFFGTFLLIFFLQILKSAKRCILGTHFFKIEYRKKTKRRRICQSLLLVKFKIYNLKTKNSVNSTDFLKRPSRWNLGFRVPKSIHWSMHPRSHNKISWDRQCPALPEGVQRPSQICRQSLLICSKVAGYSPTSTEDCIRRRSAAPKPDCIFSAGRRGSAFGWGHRMPPKRTRYP